MRAGLSAEIVEYKNHEEVMGSDLFPLKTRDSLIDGSPSSDFYCFFYSSSSCCCCFRWTKLMENYQLFYFHQFKKLACLLSRSEPEEWEERENPLRLKKVPATQLWFTHLNLSLRFYNPHHEECKQKDEKL